jgi:hypothetical protein
MRPTKSPGSPCTPHDMSSQRSVNSLSCTLLPGPPAQMRLADDGICLMGRHNGDLQSLPESGSELVGKEIAIKFSGYGFFEGKVTSYDAQKDKYIVAYEGGKEYTYQIDKVVKGIDDMQAMKAKRKGFEQGTAKQIRPTSSSAPMAYASEGAAGRAQKARASGSYAPHNRSASTSPIHSASASAKTREAGAKHHADGRSPSSSLSGPSPFKQDLASSQESMRKVCHSLPLQSLPLVRHVAAGTAHRLPASCQYGAQ